ncbi:MAG TPA: YaeQ family protein [Polyangia bacterium]|nr:YaeQ family protein [Polyangia bacterium]
MSSPSPLQLRIALAHVDRGIDVVEKIIVGRDPETSPEHVMLRVIAWCLFHAEGLRLADGAPRRDVPDLAVIGLDLKAQIWIAVGTADAEEIRRVVAHNRGVTVHVLVDDEGARDRLLAQIAGIKKRPPGFDDLSVWMIDRAFVRALAARDELRQRWAVTVVADHIYVDADGTKADSAFTRTPAPPYEG